MLLSENLDINEVNNLYLMYNELYSFSNINKDYESALKYFYKLSKYFKIVYSEALKNPNTKENQIHYLTQYYAEVKEAAINASKNLCYENFSEINIDDEPDEFEQILFSNQKKDEMYNKLGLALFNAGANLSAVNYLKRALQINSNNVENYKIIADFYNSTQEYKKALAFYLEYDKFSPGNPYVYVNIGAIYSIIDRLGTLDNQIKYFKKAVDIMPNSRDAIRNLAITYQHADNQIESSRYYKRLMEVSTLKDDEFIYACHRIKFGDFNEGWKHFEVRFDRETLPIPAIETDKPKWDGKIDLSNSTLLVQYEQGLGDSIQFFRYLKQIKAKKIIFWVQDSLVDLLKLNAGDIEIISKSTPIKELSFDYHVSIMSLIHLLNARKDTIPLAEGYIKADKEKTQKYKKEFFDNKCFKIGFTWHGASWGNEFRNIPLNCFLPFSQMKNVKLYSFQKDPNDEISEELFNKMGITDLGKTFNDFSDTAAALSNVDLFITADNSTFNLAAAMGVKTFVILNRDSEWRWFFDEEKTPWYDSVRIFKKKYEQEPWEDVMKRALNSIQAFTPAN